MTGIYMIKNKINNRIYVGQSKDIYSRWYKHKKFLTKQAHHNRELQKDWLDYGENNFSFSILEQCDETKLNERESYWINQCKSFDEGYNLDIGGDGLTGYKHTNDEILKMRLIQNPMVVLEFDTNFNFIREWIGGVSHIGKETGYTVSSIKKRCEHTYKEMSSYKDRYWVFKKEYENEDFSWDKYLANEKIINIIKKKKVNKKICQYDLNRNLVKIWDNYTQLKDNGYNRQAICTICNQSRGKQTHKNYIWAFEGYDFSDGYFDIIGKQYNFTKNK